MAAGWGSRLGELTEYKPKALLEIGGETLLARSVRLLKSAGISRIIIGTGYCGHVIEEAMASDGAIACVRMDRYRDTNSMYTLRGMAVEITEDFLVLESDVLYEERAISHLLAQPEPDVLLGSGPTDSGDEVYIETDSQGRLVNMSKDKRILNNASAELVGIGKLSQKTYQAMCKFAERQVTFHPAMYYEEALIEMAWQRPISVARVDDLIWCEIDDLNHLQRAKHIIWPAIAAKEKVGLKAG